jgi:hypothetical protein
MPETVPAPCYFRLPFCFTFPYIRPQVQLLSEVSAIVGREHEGSAREAPASRADVQE